MTTTVPISRTMERGILSLFIAAAAVIALALVLPPIRQAVQMAGGVTQISLLTVADVPHTAAESGPQLSSATFESAWVVATGLSDAARGLLIADIAVAALASALAVGAVVYFLLMLLWRRPFHRSLIVATQIAGTALLIGSALSLGLGGLGRMMAADELNPIADDVFVVGFAFDPAPMFTGIVVLALSVVFRYGTRLQRDSDGLV